MAEIKRATYGSRVRIIPWEHMLDAEVPEADMVQGTVENIMPGGWLVVVLDHTVGTRIIASDDNVVIIDDEK